MTELLPCPCCGERTLVGPLEAYGEWCSRCNWEICPEAVEEPDGVIRPNYVSLNEARQFASEFGPEEAGRRNRAGTEWARAETWWTVPVPPLVVAEGHDVSIYGSEKALTSELEPWFADEEHVAFDSAGRRLRLFADPPVVKTKVKFLPVSTDNAHHSTLRVELAEQKATGEQELRRILTEYLSETDASFDANTSILHLLRRATELGDYYK